MRLIVQSDNFLNSLYAALADPPNHLLCLVGHNFLEFSWSVGHNMDMSYNDIKLLYFIGTARRDLKGFPQTVRDNVGFDLYEVQRGKTPETAKPLKGFSGVMELVERYRKDTYRAVYVTKIGGVVYVLHCFKKKSKHGIKTPKEDINLIRQRLRLAQEQSKEGGKKQ